MFSSKSRQLLPRLCLSLSVCLSVRVSVCLPAWRVHYAKFINSPTFVTEGRASKWMRPTVQQMRWSYINLLACLLCMLLYAPSCLMTCYTFLSSSLWQRHCGLLAANFGHISEIFSNRKYFCGFKYLYHSVYYWYARMTAWWRIRKVCVCPLFFLVKPN